MKKEEITNGLIELSKPEKISRFDPTLVGPEALDQMIGAHQLKYIEALIQSEEEQKLANENTHDLSHYPIEIQEKCFEHAEKATYDPDYFSRHKIDPEFVKPIQIVMAIKAKKEEAKQKTWKVEYHGRLIARLRFFRMVAGNKTVKKSFLKRVLGI